MIGAMREKAIRDEQGNAVMGYSNKFSGELRFTRDLKARELAFVKSLFWIKDDEIATRNLLSSKGKIHYVQFKLTDDFSGIRWDGSEKFYKAVEAANFVIENLRAMYPDLGLTGTMEAQGEEADDRWLLVIGEDGRAKRVEKPVAGTKVTCPHCDETFMVDAT